MTGKPTGARPNREGKPWLRPDGRWIARVYPPGGGIDRKPRYVYGRTRAEVKQKQAELEAELAKGLPEDKDQTVGEYMTRWLDETLEQYAHAGQLARSTLDSYRDNARRHIIPADGPSLAHIRLRDLSAPVVREWQHRLSRKPSARTPRRVRKGEQPQPPETLSPRTVAYCHAILHKAVQDAVRDGTAGLERNVVSLVQPPSGKDRKETVPPTAEDAAALLAAMSEDRWWCYWLVAFAVGFRRGEGLGMRWADLDLEDRIWWPGESVQWMRGEPGADGRRKGKLVSKGLKTRASRDPVALPLAAAEGLQRWELEQKKMILAAPVWADLNLVFTTNAGTAIGPRNINRQWDKVCSAAGVRRIRLHDLRHACGSYLAAEKVAPKVIQRTMRHARFSTTAEIYLHAIEAVPREGADAMDRVIARLKGH